MSRRRRAKIRRMMKFFLVGVGVVVVVVAVRSLENTPITGRIRSNLCWPWTTVSHVGEVDDDTRILISKHLASDWETMPRWVNTVLQQLVSKNEEVPLFRDFWAAHVIRRTLNVLSCFVTPSTKEIFISEMYLNFIEDEGQIGSVLGHELSHAVCGHAKDFCFMAFSRDVALIVTGAVVGWCWLTEEKTAQHSRRRHEYHRSPERESTDYFWTRFSRFFLIAGLASLATAILVNLAFTLPYRRLLESEADAVGMQMAAKACLNLKSVPKHWDQLNTLIVSQLPEWRSTHPSFQKRKFAMMELLPMAQELSYRHCDYGGAFVRFPKPHGYMRSATLF